MSSKHSANQPCIAIIADIVRSRESERRDRAKLQHRFEAFVEDLNNRYRHALLSPFAVTLGDEFEGLLRTGSDIPNLLWDFEDKAPNLRLRAGIGYGPIYTKLSKQIAKMDGPVFHNARDAVERARRERELGGVFVGFNDLDPMLNGLARLLWYHRSRWTKSQRAVAGLMRIGLSQVEIAHKFRKSRQAISKHVVASGWTAYIQAENAFQLLLRKYVDKTEG